MADAAAVAAAIAAVAVREPEIIVDLAALEFIDSSGVAAARARLARSVSTYRVTGDVAGMAAQAVPPADQTDPSGR